MKVLNRPMFRYGGPIKEGIMSGIQEPRQGYQDAGSVFKNVQAVLQDGTAADPKVLNEAAKLGIGNPYRVQEFKPYMKKVVTKPKIDMSETDQLAAEVEQIDPVEPLTELQKAKIGKTFIGTEEYRQKVKELEALEEANKLKSKADGTVTTQGKSPFAYTLDEVIENKGKTDSVDDEPKVLSRKEKVNSILEGLGYDRAQKNALYDAMIKAGQRISRTGLGAENLVSDVIAETSQSYDKPEKLREAANLMQVQQDLKLDQIKASKEGTGTMNQNYNYFKARGYSDEDASRKAEGLATNLLEAKNKAIDAKLTGNKLTEYVAQQLIGVSDAYDNNTYKGTTNSKDHKSVSDFVKSTDFDGAGVYTVKGRIIELDKNGKILKEEIVTSSTSDKKWWNFGKEE
ncbi:MAG: hypothetical protein CMQ85_03060 [Gammaproteobacteria bacterium]|nr:hypothetical protein [Gammaproteobacteria bacterium]